MDKFITKSRENVHYRGRKLVILTRSLFRTVETDRHSVSCIVMQRAENVPGAFFRFTLGKTSLFAVFAAESA
ncbi:hypothetical protein KUR41_005228 [Escherichia coli]|nr:hypothetical protein [Escherichia coli]EHR9219726.1 hypothetical protein [Escherichia coli]